MGRSFLTKTLFVLILIPINILPQFLNLSGNITTENLSVKNALIIFTNAADSLQVYSTITDSSGNYNIIITGINDEENYPNVNSFKLEQNYPNPFTEKTTIKYELKEQSSVQLIVYDILGKEVNRFNYGEKFAGTHNINWDGRNSLNQKVTPGVYFYQLFNGKDKITKKMLYGFLNSQTIIRYKQPSTIDYLKKESAGQELLFVVRIRNEYNTTPQIQDTLFTNVVIKDNAVLNFVVKEVAKIKTYNIDGYIKTKADTLVKYAEIVFKEIIDTNKIFSTFTDSSGYYNITIADTFKNKLLNIQVNSLDDTQPKVYSQVFDSILISSDTLINFQVESVGPWVKVKRNILSWLQDIDFADSLNGWTVGRRYHDSDDEILHTTDGGDSWTKQVSPVDDDFQGVDFIDSQIGWICSRHSILKTTDGGDNWKVVFHEDFGDTGYLRDIEFLNDSIGFALGGKGLFASIGVLLKTTDAGETWTDIAQPGWTTLTKISIVDNQNIWICGFGGTIINTTDMGLSWTKKTIGSLIYTRFLAIQFVNKLYGWIGSDDEESEFYRTTDGGETWQSEPYALYLSLGIKSFFFVDSLNGWLAPILGGGSWAIINTKDGGKIWNFLPIGTSLTQIRSFYFVNKKLGWAVSSEAINTNPRSVILRYKVN